MKALRILPVVALALFGLIIMPGVAGAAPRGDDHGYVCTGGDVPSGTYSSIKIAGICYMPSGTVIVRHNLTVAPGALLDAVMPGDPAANPLLPATVLVGGNVYVGAGAVLVLGCSPHIGCHAVSFDRIRGNLIAIGAEATVVHSVSIGGNAIAIGGGGGVAGGADSGACFAAPIPAPWSEDSFLSNPTTGSPQYTDFEDNTIGGNLKVLGVQTCWLGSLRNRVGGSLSLAGNATSDPDGMEVTTNLVWGTISCFGNLPAVQFGDGATAPNLVGGRARGECGFGVTIPDPAPSGTSNHVSVRIRSLNTYSGTHKQVGASINVPLGPNVTASGDQLAVELNNDIIGGKGLECSITLPSSPAPGGPGETVVVTTRPNGTASFEAFDTGTCRFQGRTGTVSIEAYGNVSRDGTTRGTFLVASGGSGNGDLATLAGGGTFTSAGEPSGTLHLVEYLTLS